MQKLISLSRNQRTVLTPAIPAVDRVLVPDSWPHGHHWHTILTSRYDYCLDFTRTDRSAFLAFVSRAKKKITYERTKVRSKWRPLIYDQFIDSSVRHNHTVDHHLAFLEPLGIANPEVDLHLNLPAEAQAKVEEILQREDIEGPFVIFHPGSARTEKFWEAQHWAEAINHWRGSGMRRILTSGSSALEQAHIAEIKRDLSEPIVDLSGKLDLLTLTALIGRASLLGGS